jgi:hypothetical protein
MNHLYKTTKIFLHCHRESAAADVAIQSGLLRYARNDGHEKIFVVILIAQSINHPQDSI